MTLITSLWEVEDESARSWRHALYEARFVKGMRAARAVHEASLEVLSDRRRKSKSTHPS